MNIKQCKKCGQEKPLTTDYFNLLSSGGWRGTCKSCMAANTRAHYQRNPDKVKDRVKIYNDLKKQAGGIYTAEDINTIRKRLENRCSYCSTSLEQTEEIDHMQPISRGGHSDPSNLTLACRKCNRDKHNKSAMEFIAWRIKLNLPINQNFIEFLLKQQ
jgi:5-methylcytosine-specific restriction endonuclease McrA